MEQTATTRGEARRAIKALERRRNYVVKQREGASAKAITYMNAEVKGLGVGIDAIREVHGIDEEDA